MIVSHRLSSLTECDQILVLEKGEAVDIAPHRTLLERCALYRQLWAQQNRHLDSQGPAMPLSPPRSPMATKAISDRKAIKPVAKRTAIEPVDDRNDPTLPVILEFQSPSAGILAAPVPRAARGTIWTITSLFFACLLPMGLIPIDKVVTAQGKVVSQAPTIVVQPLETAIVRSILVREGQTVHAGDVLARLDPTFAAADAGALQAQVASLQAEVSRLQAEAEDKPFVYTGLDPALSLQAAIYAQRQAERTFRLENYPAEDQRPDRHGLAQPGGRQGVSPAARRRQERGRDAQGAREAAGRQQAQLARRHRQPARNDARARHRASRLRRAPSATSPR